MVTGTVNYPKSYDAIYRSGYIIGFIGICLFTVFFILNNIFSASIGVIIFDIGTLLSGLFLLVWRKEIKVFIVSCIITGLILTLMLLFVFSTGGLLRNEIFIVATGLVLAGMGGMYGKEAHCFHFFEGWVLMWSFPVIILINLIVYGLNLQLVPAVHFLLSAIYIFIALLALSFLIKKLTQPLMQFCENA